MITLTDLDIARVADAVVARLLALSPKEEKPDWQINLNASLAAKEFYAKGGKVSFCSRSKRKR